MYEIIADPKDYGIEALIEGMGYKKIAFPEKERLQWATEVGRFAVRLEGLSEKVRYLEKLLKSETEIMATPASLKTFKVQLFKINDALESALALAHKAEADIVKK